MQPRADLVSFVAAGILMVSGVWIAWGECHAPSPPSQARVPGQASWTSESRLGGPVGLHGEPITPRTEAFAARRLGADPVLQSAARDAARSD